MKTGTKVVLGFFAGVGVAATLGVAVAHKNMHGFGHGGGRYMIEHVEQRLDLAPSQVNKLEELVDQVYALRTAWREQRVVDYNKVRELISAPTLNQQELIALIEDKTAQVNELTPGAVEALAGFADSLTAEQKREVLDMMEHRFERRRHWHKHH